MTTPATRTIAEPHALQRTKTHRAAAKSVFRLPTWRAARSTAGTAVAENADDEGVADPVTAHIAVPNQGEQDLAPNSLGMFPRVVVQVNEKVPVTVTYAQAEPGDTVALQMVDGGTLDNGTISMVAKLDASKALHFVAGISEQEGIHRVELSKGADRQQLEFWAGVEAPPRK